MGAKVVGELMKMVGEKVEYVPIDSQTVYQSMADGDIDIVHEIWNSAFGTSYEKAKESGRIEEILTHDAVPREDWWYPEYVEKVCPGMPDWKALAKCSAKFARPDSFAEPERGYSAFKDISCGNRNRIGSDMFLFCYVKKEEN